MKAREILLRGIAASSGIAIGPAYYYVIPDLNIPMRSRETVEQELARFDQACAQANDELQELHNLLIQRAGDKQAAIFEAHQMMLDDPMLLNKVRSAVEAGEIIEQAVVTATEDIAKQLAGMDNELFAARAVDIQDVGRRILRILLGLPDSELNNIKVSSIIVAYDLTPSDTAKLDPQMTLGFCTVSGGLTSHSAILARTLGIPAIVALGDELVNVVSSGTELVLDGQEGSLYVHPEFTTIKKQRLIQQARQEYLATVKRQANDLAHTADGRRVEVCANIGDLKSAQEAVANGAEGVGLLRTEFLYLEETQPPNEDKQLQVYRKIFEVFGNKSVIVRTLDVGGDKPPSYLPFPKEMNPFLGWRAIRISKDHPDLFKTQLRAILRAAVGYRARIMLPMVDGLDELRWAKHMLEEAKFELQWEGLEYAIDVPIGIMVETPAAAVLVDVLAEAADFFSLGTNDLTQYTLAVDRGNASLGQLYQPLHPAVLRLIKEAIDLAHKKGKWIGMCGELAGMRKAIPILLGLGLDEFSMNSRAIPEAKHLIAMLNNERAHEITEQVLRLGTATEIEDYMGEVLKDY